jgi:hypothetical protein
MRGRSGEARVPRERMFVVLGKNDLLIFLGTLSSFQPSPGASHEDLGSDFIFEVTDKEFLEKNLDTPSVLKDNFSNAAINSSTVPNCFNLVRQPRECVLVSKWS